MKTFPDTLALTSFRTALLLGCRTAVPRPRYSPKWLNTHWPQFVVGSASPKIVDELLKHGAALFFLLPYVAADPPLLANVGHASV